MSNVLVAYFSASGVTKKVAQKLANAIGADMFEIVPEQIYTSEDLNWNGITVIPFCTSGVSGLGESGRNMQALGKGANVIDGKRLSGIYPRQN